MVRFRILGPLEVQAPDGRRQVLTATKPRILLGVLLLYANQPVGMTTLIDALWPRQPPGRAEGAVRTHVWMLRRSLHLTALTARPPGYQLDIAERDLDLLLFDHLAEEGQVAATDGDLPGAAERWQRALALWRGRPLDGLEVGAAAESALTDLVERRYALLERWAQARLELGRPAETLPALVAAAAEQPFREQLHELAMLALYRTGRQAEALEAFRQVRGRLVAELGVEPGPALQRLQRQILAADPALDAPPPAGPVVALAAAAPRQLPPDILAFTGRSAELGIAGAHLAAGAPQRPPPVVALSGAAGVGKSALAIHLAHRLAHRFPDGQLYIDLQGATAGLRPLPPLEVLGRFLRALGARATDATTVDEASAGFRAAAATRRLLVVLDNADSPEQVRPLLPAGPDTAVIVTCRRVLSTLDNAIHQPLDVLPPAEAVELLNRLVGAERIATDPAAADRIAHWCGHLPLALRIAGARLAARPSWPVRELAERLSDARRRLDELRVDELGVRSSFQVTYELLHDGPDGDDHEAAKAFPVLALADSADLSRPAAAALLGMGEPAAERVLDRLVDRALLTTPVPGRYRLHDLLRLFGRSLADGADPSALTRLVRWYAATTWQTFRLLRPADPRPSAAGEWAVGGRVFHDVGPALEWLEAERPNLIAAVRQVAETPELPWHAATSLAQGLFAYFHMRGYLNDWVEVNETARAIARRAGDPVAEAHACRDLGAAFEVRGEYGKAMACLRDGLGLFGAAGDRAGVAACLNSLGAVHDSLGQLDEAAACLERSLAISRELADPHNQGISLNNLGQVYCGLADYGRAATSLHAALAIFRGTGNRRSHAAALINLARVHESQESYAPALSCYQESLAMFAELGIVVGQAEVLTSLGRVHRLLGRLPEALERLGEAVKVAQRVDERRSTAVALRELGSTRRALGEPDAARECWGRALAIFEQIGVPEADEVRALLKDAPLSGRAPA